MEKEPEAGAQLLLTVLGCELRREVVVEPRLNLGGRFWQLDSWVWRKPADGKLGVGLGWELVRGSSTMS